MTISGLGARPISVGDYAFTPARTSEPVGVAAQPAKTETVALTAVATSLLAIILAIMTFGVYLALTEEKPPRSPRSPEPPAPPRIERGRAWGGV